MSPHAYTEDQLVEQPAIGLFAALGWCLHEERLASAERLRPTRHMRYVLSKSRP